MAVVRDKGKTAFVKSVLLNNNEANAEIVNSAWTEAGHDGSISSSLVKKMRAELKLTRSGRRGRPPRTAGPRPTTVVRRPAERSPSAANGTQRAPATASAPRTVSASSERTRTLQELEGAIDGLIFRSLSIGGLDEFEEALRKARRILVRAHQD